MDPLQLTEAFMIRLCLFREARNCSHEAKRGILHVIFNRAANPKGPYKSCKTVLETILCHAQFSSFSPTDRNSHVLPNPNDPMEWAAWLDCCDVADNPVSDPTNGANYYHSWDPHSPMWPSWAQNDLQTAQIGPFRFYKL